METKLGWHTDYENLKFTESFFWYIHPPETCIPREISIRNSGHTCTVNISYNKAGSAIDDLVVESFSLHSWIRMRWNINFGHRNIRIHGIGHRVKNGSVEFFHFDEEKKEWIKGIPENQTP